MQETMHYEQKQSHPFSNHFMICLTVSVLNTTIWMATERIKPASECEAQLHFRQLYNPFKLLILSSWQNDPRLQTWPVTLQLL